jgi:hypothetical protein
LPICKLSTLGALLAFVPDILDLYFLLSIPLGLSPWRFVASGTFYSPSSGDLRLFFHQDMRSGFDKVRIACLRLKGRSILVFPFLLPETSCLHILPLLLLRNPQLPDFAFLGYPWCDVISSVYLFCQLLVSVHFCYYMRPLRQRICWLLPLAQLLSLVLFFLSLPRDLSDEVRPKKHLLLIRRRRPLPSFWLHSIVVYKNVEFCLFFTHTLWLSPMMLGACMLNGNFL